METTWRNITLEAAKRGIRAYNEGLYHGLKNVEIDRQARATFSSGLGTTYDEILRQVTFIGRDYGGVAGQPGAISLAPEIADDILQSRDQYHRTAIQAAPIAHQIASRSTIEVLYHPFVKPFNRSSKWQTWGSKFWHFLNPDAFPIADSRVNKFFGLFARTNSIEMYLELLKRFRDFTQSHRDWLPHIREIDSGTAWCDNKLWDKMCYGLPEVKT